MPQPSFINIGPGRCATSWLFQLLKSHPEICLSKAKETEFFNTNFANGIPWYEDQFESPTNGAVGCAAIGEFSANYYLDPKIANAIKSYNPNIKLIINVRNPYELLQSFHAFAIRRGIEVGELDAALSHPIGPIMGSGYSHRKKKNALTTADQVSLLESVCLADRLQPFFDAFPREQIYVFVVERLASNYSQVLTEVFDFLNVDASHQPANADQVVNSAITPKSKILARLATATSFTLRRVGAYGVLTRLHRSEMIKRLLYRSNGLAKQSVRDQLNPAAQARIDSQIELLKQRLPQLETGWP